MYEGSGGTSLMTLTLHPASFKRASAFTVRPALNTPASVITTAFFAFKDATISLRAFKAPLPLTIFLI